MNLSEVFIRRPIATSLLMAAIALFGVIACTTLPISDMPNVEYPTINVTAALPGADPAVMASSVATVLERQFTTIPGLDSMTSNSTNGNTNVTLQFNLDREIDGAASDVQSAISAVTPLLPPGMPFPPSFRRSNPIDQPVLFLVLSSDTLPLSKLEDYAEILIAPRISTISGVAQIQISGGQKYAVRVQVDPDKLVSKRIGLNEVNAAIANWNPNLPTGALYGSHRSYTVVTNAELKNAAEFAKVIVAWRKGAPVRLGEIANVVDSVEDTHQATWIYDEEGARRTIQVTALHQPGANDIVISDAIKKLLPQIQAQMPPSAKLAIRSDRSRVIRQSFADARFTLQMTLGLVICVIFLLLRNVRATIIPAMALPFVLMGTFAVMALLHYQLDELSMMAVILAVAFVVDDAIVMLENIMRHIELGERPYEAALKGSKEVGFTLICMTVSLTAVFMPVLFMRGVLGIVFREFAVTIIAAIVISGFVSITLIPMLSSRFLRINPASQEGWFSRALDWPFKCLFEIYRRTLRVVLRWRPVMGLLFVGVLGLTVYLFQEVPKGFVPDEDQDFINIPLRAAQGTSFYKMVDYVRRAAAIVRPNSEVSIFLANAQSGTNGNLNVQLEPASQRAAGIMQIIDRLRPRLATIPGLQAFPAASAPLRIGGRQSNSAYQFTLKGTDTDELYKQADIMEAEMRKIPEVNDISTDLQIKNPMVKVKIDRERTALYGLDAREIESALYSAYGPQIVSTIYTPASQYRVLEEIKPSDQEWVDGLSKIYFKASGGQLVPLDSLASVEVGVGPQSIAHTGQFPSVTLSFNVKNGVSLGTAVDRVTEVAKRILPPTITANFSGTAQTFQESLQNLTLLLIIAIAVVYIVLGILYESYIHPLTILSGVPAAGVGALLTLLKFHSELNIYSFVGLMMLIGIVMKNAIMQIDFALEAERNLGKTPIEAIYEGCLIRFRPIVMTTMAAMMAALPIALGYGSGGEARRPLGLAVVGGLVLSQLMTLYLTPVIYTYMSGGFGWFRARSAVPVTQERVPSLGFSD